MIYPLYNTSPCERPLTIITLLYPLLDTSLNSTFHATFSTISVKKVFYSTVPLQDSQSSHMKVCMLLHYHWLKSSWLIVLFLTVQRFLQGRLWSLQGPPSETSSLPIRLHRWYYITLQCYFLSGHMFSFICSFLKNVFWLVKFLYLK